MHKQELAAQIWKGANEMRGKIEAGNYKDFILGLLFYKFLSENEVKYLKDNLGASKEDLAAEDVKTYLIDNLGYYIPEENLFSSMMGKDKGMNIGSLSATLSNFNLVTLENPLFSNIFRSLNAGLMSLGENDATRSQMIVKLARLIDNIPMKNAGGYDVLGFIYEYLIGQFASSAGKKAGEFYTPHEVSELMAEIVAYSLKDRERISVYDPTSGSGSLLITIGKAIEKQGKSTDSIRYFAQEIIEATYNLTRMNLVMRGIIRDNISTSNNDTLRNDWPRNTLKDEPLLVDAVVSNPPYSLKWNPDGMAADPRFQNYGLAPKSAADFAFLLHDLYHLKYDGILTIVLPHGVLFRGGEEERIRTQLLKLNQIDAVIGLPPNIFFGTGIPTIIMVLKKSREQKDVLFIDASKGFEKVTAKNKLRARDIRKAVEVWKDRKELEGFSRRVSFEEIENNGFNLNIPRYIASSEEERSDLYSLIYSGIPKKEIDTLQPFWNVFEGLKEKLFNQREDGYFVLKENAKEILENFPAIIEFKKKVHESFKALFPLLKQKLIAERQVISQSLAFESIASEILEQAEKLPLIDKYEAFELFSQHWTEITNDMEALSSQDGSEVFGEEQRQEKTDERNNPELGKEEITSYGEASFQLGAFVRTFIQERYFPTKLEELSSAERSAELAKEELKELYGEIPEDFEFDSAIDQDKEVFIPKEIKALSKAIAKDEKAGLTLSESQEFLKKVASQISAADKTRKEAKKIYEELDGETSKKQQSLTEEEFEEILTNKWIYPLVKSWERMGDDLVFKFSEKLSTLQAEHSSSFIALEEEIKKTSDELSSLLSELQADEIQSKALKALQELIKG
ncbi:type I restriction-modification system subunit M [Parasutterella excrementihominis]|uniref:type I restriction-modification system subunit M n=1 Tax=Parasutterella excrementihominis TaxID=487175 RepID=UPI002665BC5C|nr:type I restriction-modification system subunit M [Parasutterella excrementihominis]